MFLQSAIVRPLASAVTAALVCVPTYAQMLVERANNYWQQRDWERATTDYAMLVKENPFQGLYWLRHAIALLQLRKFDEAVPSYDMCLKLSYDVDAAKLGLGVCCGQKGDHETAFRYFDEVIASDPTWLDRLQEPNYRSMLTEPVRQRIYQGYPTDSTSRIDGWRFDLALAKKVLYRSHYRIFIKTSETVWEREFRRINDAIPNLTDKEISLELMKFVALAGDGHTTTWPMYRKSLDFHLLPVLIYPFKDGCYIRAAAPEHAEIVGARVTRVGDKPIEELLKAVEAFGGHENPMHALNQAPTLLSTVEVLQMVGAAQSDTETTLTIEKNKKPTLYKITATAWDPALHGPRDEAPTWVQMNAKTTNPEPLSRKNPRESYWFEYLAKEKILYFQYRNMFDSPEKPFASFLHSMFAEIDRQPVEAFVIDLRQNFGGSSELYKPLIEEIIRHPKINEKGKLFTLIGRMTYSAAMNLSTDLEFWTRTLFIGEPTGCSPNFIGENKLFTLPYSKIKVSVSDRYHQKGESLSLDKRIWIAPNIAAQETSETYQDNVDPSLQEVVKYLRYRFGSDK